MAKATGRTTVTMEEFVTAALSSTSKQEVADKTKLQIGSVEARFSSYRSQGIAMPTYDRKKSVRLDVSGANALIAKLTKQSVETVTDAGEKLATAASERKAKREAAETK